MNTTQLADPVSYDDDFLAGEGPPKRFMGVLKYHNCECGDTLVLHSIEPDHVSMLEIMEWVRNEHQRTGRTIAEMLHYYGEEVDKRVLGGLVGGEERADV